VKSKIIFAIVTLLFCASVIVWIILYGKGDNSLHASALSWSFSIAAGVLAGIGFSVVAYLVPAWAAARAATKENQPQ
jgi:hypothetical protein